MHKRLGPVHFFGLEKHNHYSHHGQNWQHLALGIFVSTKTTAICISEHRQVEGAEVSKFLLKLDFISLL